MSHEIIAPEHVNEMLRDICCWCLENGTIGLETHFQVNGQGKAVKCKVALTLIPMADYLAFKASKLGSRKGEV